MRPIPVSEFSSHVERLHADRDKLFEMEYEVRGFTKPACGMSAGIPNAKREQSSAYCPLSQLELEEFFI